MPKVKLHAKGIDALTATTGQVDYFDTGAHVPGFGIRVTPHGKSRTWFLLYRVSGQQKRLKIGTYPPMGLAEARTAARRQLLGVQVDEADPAAAKRKRRTAMTFGTLADEYLTLYAKVKKRSWREDGRQLRTMVLPRWKNRPAIEITKGDISTLIDDVFAARGGTTANRLHALLSKVFRWALSKDKLPANPMAGLQKPAPETSRDRELTDDEIRTLWQQLDAADADKTLTPGIALWLRLRLLTAQRGGSIAAMKWADVDLERGVWDVPAADMKTGKPHVVPLSPAVVALLTAQRIVVGPDATYVLEGARSRRIRLGVTDAVDLPNFTPHDLRRTAATGMAKSGIPRFIVARVLGHVDRTVTGIYDRYEYLNEKRVALDTWARRVASIVENPQAGTVVPFVKGA